MDATSLSFRSLIILCVFAFISSHTPFGTATAMRTTTLILPNVSAIRVGFEQSSFGYFATDTTPGTVVKVLLPDLQQVGLMTAAQGEDRFACGFGDGTYGYFGTQTAPGLVVKVRLDDMLRYATASGAAGEDRFVLAVTDGAHGYFVTATTPSRIVKFRLSDMMRVDSYIAAAGTKYTVAITDGTFGYFGTSDSPAQIVKVRLSDMTHVATLTLPAGLLTAAVTDGTYGYFAVATTPIAIRKVDLSTMTLGERAYIGVATDDACTAAVVFHSSAYFAAPSRVVVFSLSNMTHQDSEPFASTLSPNFAFAHGSAIFFGIATTPASVFRLEVESSAGVNFLVLLAVIVSSLCVVVCFGVAYYYLVLYLRHRAEKMAAAQEQARHHEPVYDSELVVIPVTTPHTANATTNVTFSQPDDVEL